MATTIICDVCGARGESVGTIDLCGGCATKALQLLCQREPELMSDVWAKMRGAGAVVNGDVPKEPRPETPSRLPHPIPPPPPSLPDYAADVPVPETQPVENRPAANPVIPDLSRHIRDPIKRRMEELRRGYGVDVVIVQREGGEKAGETVAHGGDGENVKLMEPVPSRRNQWYAYVVT